jgi:endonuclease III
MSSGPEEVKPLETVEGLHATTQGKLKAAGFDSLQDLPDTLEELLEIEGIGQKTAEQILALK